MDITESMSPIANKEAGMNQRCSFVASPFSRPLRAGLAVSLLCVFELWAGAAQAASYFLALDLPAETRQSIVNRQEYIAAFLPTNTSVAWHPTNNLHITLQGVADTLTTNQLAALSNAMQAVARSAERFNLADKVVNSTCEVWDGYIVFKLKPSRTLRALGDAIYDGVKEAGLPRDARQKHFHVSIGTYTSAVDRTLVKSLSVRPPACSAFPVSSFALRKSNYPAVPRRYDELARYWYRNKTALSLRDYNADGHSDLSVYNPESAEWRIALVPDITNVFALQSSGADLAPVSGLFDGDALTDVGSYRESDGAWAVLCSSNNYATQTCTLGGPGFLPVPGDYDADGLTDPAVYQAANGYWKFLLSASDYASDEAYLGGPGFTAAPEDYDGDGETDLAVYQESSGLWQIMLSDSEYDTASGNFGGPGWAPVTADYDGDGLADPALDNSSTGEWIVLLSTGDYTAASLVLGGAGWTPSPCDFDGDGLADPTAYQEATGLWQTCPSGSGYQPVSAVLGGPGWIPVP